MYRISKETTFGQEDIASYAKYGTKVRKEPDHTIVKLLDYPKNDCECYSDPKHCQEDDIFFCNIFEHNSCEPLLKSVLHVHLYWSV
jgi:hypothetical protein